MSSKGDVAVERIENCEGPDDAASADFRITRSGSNASNILCSPVAVLAGATGELSDRAAAR